MLKKIKQGKKGVALIMAVVVMMIIVLLCTSLMMISYSVFSTSSKQYQLAQSRELALTITQEIEREITNVSFRTGTESESETYEDQQKALQAGKYPLWFYLRYNLFQTNWPYYNTDEAGHGKKFAYRYFDLALNNEGLAVGEWNNEGLAVGEWNKATDKASVLIYYESEDQAAHNDTPLIVKVTCTKGEQSSTVKATYILTSDYYDPPNTENENSPEGGEGGTSGKEVTDDSDNYKEIKENDCKILEGTFNPNPKNNKITKYERWKWGKPEIE